MGEPDRYARLRRIEQLDPARDWLEIHGLTSMDFQSLLFTLPFAGFMMTFAAPKISRILYRTGEITDRFAKRAVDTILFTSIIHKSGFGSPVGRKAAQRVNRIHAQYDIAVEEFLIVGSDPCLFMLDICDRYGWRPLIPAEREAQRIYQDRQARAFGSRKPLPPTEAEMRAFVDRYFETELHYEKQNEVMAKKAIDWFVALAPPAARPLMRRMLLSSLDERILRACGIKSLSPIDKAIGHLGLKYMGRKDPVPDGGPDFFGDLVATVYPNGYELDEIGPKLASEKA